MGFACRYCGYTNEVEPKYSEEQEKKYVELERRMKKVEEECKKISENCSKEFEDRKNRRQQWFTPYLIVAVGSYLSGIVFAFLNMPWAPWIIVGLIFGGVIFGVGSWWVLGKLCKVSWEKVLRDKHPEILESKDFRIFWFSKYVEPSNSLSKECEENHWNYSFLCQFCQRENRFWRN